MSILVASLFVTSAGCKLLKKDEASSSSSTSDSSSSSTTTSTTPTYGMDCTSYNGYDSMQSYPTAFVSSITGSTITTVKFNLFISDGTGATSVVNFSNTAGTVTLTAYNCASAGSLGPSVGTATMNNSLNGHSAQKTFTFNSPITIPTNCNSGEAPVAFAVSWTGYGGYHVWSNSNINTTSCFLKQSSTNTGAVARPRGWMATITATP